MMRTITVLFGLPLLLLSSLPTSSLAQGSADLDGTPLKRMDVQTLQIELERAERDLRDFEDYIGGLESASKKSSNSDRRRSVDRLREAMVNWILKVEDELGQEHTIRMHGQEVTQTTTKEIEKTTSSGRLPQTGRKIRYQGPADLYNAFYRLTRMQEIFISCRTIEEHAIAKETQALDRYHRLVSEFKMLMDTQIQEIRDLIPEAEEDPYGLAEPDSI